MCSRKYVGDLKKKKKALLAHWMLLHASHKAEKNLNAQGRAILTKPLHLWPPPFHLQGSSTNYLQRINQSIQITIPVDIKNHRLNNGTDFTASYSLFPLPSQPLRITQVINRPYLSTAHHINLLSCLSLINHPLLHRYCLPLQLTLNYL